MKIQNTDKINQIETSQTKESENKPRRNCNNLTLKKEGQYSQSHNRGVFITQTVLESVHSKVLIAGAILPYSNDHFKLKA